VLAVGDSLLPVEIFLGVLGDEDDPVDFVLGTV
jgi:hypothetical protein